MVQMKVLRKFHIIFHSSFLKQLFFFVQNAKIADDDNNNIRILMLTYKQLPFVVIAFRR